VPAPAHVLIAGGGVGALEALLALQHLAGARVRVSVLTAGRYLTYRALSVAEPFGGEPAQRHEWAAIAADRGVRWVPDQLTAIRPDAREVATRDGAPEPYDALLLALGARPETALPGALTFAGARDVLAVGEALRALPRDGARRRAVFVAPPGVGWTLPLYELALMTARFAADAGLPLEVQIVTREDAPLGIFGAEASRAVAERLAAGGVRVRTATFATEVAGGAVWLELEGPLEADLVVALPRLTGPAVDGLPCDGDGFVPVDRYARVPGVDAVWAVGDMTTRPLKQGGLAAQQADVAAAGIAAAAGADVEVAPYAPRLQGVLLTGGDPLYLERRPHAPSTSSAATGFLWWPAHKVVGRHVARYLEARAPGEPGAAGAGTAAG
jgi:sulfide:quinone oxidoreductase